MAFTERDFLAIVSDLARRQGRIEGLSVGPGDDAAVCAPGAGELVLTTDMLIDGVDVRLAQCGYRAAGRKAMAKNLSDLAAMAAHPWLALVSVALPPNCPESAARELLDGVFACAAEYGCGIAGGDTKRSPGPLIVDVALVGRAGGRPPVLRSGARRGDALLVSGPLGGAALGHHLEFLPRIGHALRLRERHAVSAMLDLSDGLALDLHRLCAASGVGAVLDAAAIPISAAARTLAERDGPGGEGALGHALHDGEDYELLAAVPADRAGAILEDAAFAPRWTRIGTITEPPGVVLRGDGGTRDLPARGFEHRFDEGAAP